MNALDRLIASVAPERALRRVQSRRALMHYDAATTGRRSKSWAPNSSDADGAAARRARLSFITRDMIRNTPLATRAQMVITNNVIGDGIIPKIVAPTETLTRNALEMTEAHLDTTAIDADGRSNLYGLQRLIMNAVVESGEVLIRRRKRERADGLPLPFQIQVLEADYLDGMKDGQTPNGNMIIEGIEYDLIGRRVAYHLFDQHPGAQNFFGFRNRAYSRRVPASEVIHVYRQDRPGQRRGVSWFAPVALNLQDLADHQDAKLVQQKIAACFAAFRVNMDGEPSEDEDDFPNTLKPGAILDMAPGEDIRFATPPSVQGFDEFTRVVIRSVASGLGITYDALSGDLSNVNFSSARMGRTEMDRNISSWQWLMMIPQFCQPFAGWMVEAWMTQTGNPRVGQSKITWSPPHRMLVDPTREIPALREKVRAGFASRQGVIRDLGFDPERIMEEVQQDHETAGNLKFSSSPEQIAPVEESETGNE